jgi:preprotein translocase subunit SecA
MVSKTIEGAQTRVEGFNFDTRKHVVEYDDVINRQRETIYHERERILRTDDLSPTVLAMLDEELRNLVAEHTAADFPGDWNLDGLRAQLTAIMPGIQPAELGSLDEIIDTEAMSARLVELAEDAYERKRAEVGAEGMPVLERLVLLRIIDSLWVEHLTAVDDMRRGIGLRAYSQRDPLNEFKVEAYQMFEELKATIRHDVTHTIFRVTVTREAAPQAQPQRMVESRPDVAPGAEPISATAPTNTSNNGGSPQPVRTAVKIGRNDPCFCGSGKKYKRCHGA